MSEQQKKCARCGKRWENHKAGSLECPFREPVSEQQKEQGAWTVAAAEFTQFECDLLAVSVRHAIRAKLYNRPQLVVMRRLLRRLVGREGTLQLESQPVTPAAHARSSSRSVTSSRAAVAVTRRDGGRKRRRRSHAL